MQGQLEIAYVGLESPEPAAVAHYFSEVVGLMPGQPLADGTPTWRDDHKAHRLWVQQGTRQDAVCIGFEASGPTAWQQAVDRLQALGLEVAQGTPQQLAARRVRAMARVRAPWGVDVEIVLGLADAETPFASPHYPQGFVTGGQGFGHAVFAMSADVYEDARRFCLEGLGMGLSDWLRMPLGPPGVEMHVSFLHCNARHHSLALACVPGPMPPQVLHHINFEVASVEAVGQAHERALQTKTPLANTLGQHDNDGMVSFYSVSPDGWRVEVGATGRQVGPDWNDVREYDRISRWGHQPPEALVGMLTS
jgi:2,3-dihydroxybiphenyl 1,2-dioxygenase